ncbi:hypothetical protein N478_13945 [Pseudoalteromonas luteoviolacea S4060-1]|uniref:Uncharacterized protein n=1 Tax=Pseudoalteromonas luteoviolacea S4060-1 TaxID=1365257 RepID=A0A162CJ84_9GAMM|nr:hypothetical protein N478_13945 [Pseudoalteromonas luteoviolacea S4060-1]
MNFALSQYSYSFTLFNAIGYFLMFALDSLCQSKVYCTYLNRNNENFTNESNTKNKNRLVVALVTAGVIRYV